MAQVEHDLEHGFAEWQDVPDGDHSTKDAEIAAVWDAKTRHHRRHGTYWTLKRCRQLWQRSGHVINEMDMPPVPPPHQAGNDDKSLVDDWTQYRLLHGIENCKITSEYISAVSRFLRARLSKPTQQRQRKCDRE